MRIPWKHIAIAALTLVAATAVRASLQPWVEFRVPYVTYFIAIVFIAWRTTTPVALGSVVASWLIAAYYFVPPQFGFWLLSAGDWISSIAYFASDDLDRAHLRPHAARAEAIGLERGSARADQ